MIIVTNRIRTKPGFAERMAPAFAKPGPLQSMEGFIKVEVSVRRNVSDHDEMNVSMYWKSIENFEAWKNSDAFREAHQGARGGDQGESPMLGSEIVIAEVVASVEALPAQ